MSKKQLIANIEAIDLQIGKLIDELGGLEGTEEHKTIVQEIDDLTKIRKELTESKVKDSNAPAIISGLVGISAILLVLNFEKTDVVTSKAYSMATRLLRGN